MEIILGLGLGIFLLATLLFNPQKKLKKLLLVSVLILLSGAISITTITESQPTLAYAAKKNKKQKVKKSKKSQVTATNTTAPTNAQAAASQSNLELANLDFNGTQTIDVNNGLPTFAATDLQTTNGAWEKYGDLDHLNRATSAEALLNQSLMPTTKRGSIASVKPTGWHSKKINGQYVYNRSHLIGYTLAGENANWKNLITGTRQLNSPEMLRFEMDIKYYLEHDSTRYVRYSVTPIFRGNELLARGVHLMAQSINSDAIKFNVYIFNVQEGVTLNYADGAIQTSTPAPSQTQTTQPAPPVVQQSQAPSAPAAAPATGTEQQYVDANGNGLIKGSKNGIYHLPGSQYYERTTNPAAYFKTVSEAQQAGYRAPK